MSYAKLDFSSCLHFDFVLESGVTYLPKFDGFSILDEAYTLTISDKTYSTENGDLLLVDTDEVKAIVWVIQDTDFEKGNHIGFLKSKSTITGLYLKIKITLKVI